MRLRGYIATLCRILDAHAYVLPRKPIKPVTKSFIFTQNSHDHAAVKFLANIPQNALVALSCVVLPNGTFDMSNWWRYFRYDTYPDGGSSSVLYELVYMATCSTTGGTRSTSKMELYYCHITIYPHSLSTFYVNLLFNFLYDV